MLSFAVFTPWRSWPGGSGSTRDDCKNCADPIGKVINPRAAAFAHVYCGESDEEARKMAAEASDWYIKTGLGWVATWSGGWMTKSKELRHLQLHAAVKDFDLTSTIRFDYSRNNLCIVGDVDKCIEKVKRYQESGSTYCSATTRDTGSPWTRCGARSNASEKRSSPRSVSRPGSEMIDVGTSENPVTAVGSAVGGGRRKARPVLWWAAAGVLFLGLAIYVWTMWFVSGDAHRVQPGITPVPEWMKIMNRSEEVAGTLASIYFFYRFVYRQWRREGHITLDGMLCVGFVLIFWQDPLFNYTQAQFSYNSAFFNLGSWAEHIPGWMSPNGKNLPDPLFIAIPAYIIYWFGGCLVANHIMGKAQARWARLGRSGTVGVCFAFWFVLGVVSEVVWLRTGFYHIGGAMSGWTLFHGHYYAYPLYQGFLWAGVCTIFASVRYFRNDKGQTIAERGVDRLNVSPKAKNAIRFFAIIGVLNVFYIGAYAVPIQWFGQRADTWPPDVQKRSWFTNGICGPGTTYACGGPDVPAPSPHSIHVSPDGKLVAPEGTKLPTPVTQVTRGW